MPESRGALAGRRLQAAADTLLAEAGSLSADLATWRPAADVWSVMDILCHVQEFIPYWTGQTLAVTKHPDQPWGRTPADPDRLAAVTDTARRRLADVATAIRQAAAESAAVLAGLTDAALDVEATSRNPRFGRRPAQFIVDHLLIDHVEKHTGQVRRNVRQYFVFPPPLPVAIPIGGRAERFAVQRIFCVGRNYEAHAKEMGVAVDRDAPFYFTKAALHAVAAGATVPYPPGTSNYQYEMELVVAIGTAGFRIPEARALDHVFGYACGLDMTRRDLQLAAREQQRPWDLGKDVEGSAVLGEIAPAAHVAHPGRGRIELRVNGQVKQSSDLSQLIHAVPALIAHLSQYYHLQPGDVIYTGTPEGVGPVAPGDRLEGSIEGVGTIAVQIGSPE